jgi:predicted CoA-substrate-specific enzyme activase
MKDNEVITFDIVPSGGNYKEAAQRVVGEMLSKVAVSFENIASVVTTGFGAATAPFSARQVSDISCQAKGIIYLLPSVRTVIDIGGQLSRVIKITPEGDVIDFVISEKCAATSGRFLQLMARILEVRIEDIGALSLKSTQPVKFSTRCAIFVESEALSRIAEGALKEDILAGVHKAMASNVVNLARRIGVERECAFTGGCTGDIGLVHGISESLGIRIFVPEQPFITAALGATFIASDTPSGS